MTPADTLNTRPKSVALLGLGASIYEWIAHNANDFCQTDYDEIWAVNMCLATLKHDKLFVMDDLRVQNQRMPAYGRLLQQHDRPIITSQVYPEFPMSVEFPLQEVINAVGDDYFTNTVCYAIGYAITIGVQQIALYGCDFWYPDAAMREEGGQNACYLLGMGRHFGMRFRLPQSTTLLGAHLAKVVEGRMRRPLYGYAVQPEITEENREVLADGADARPSSSLREKAGNKHPDFNESTAGR